MMYQEIRTERLLLRPVGPGDLETAFAYSADPETGRYMIFYPHADKAETAAFLEEAAAEWEKDEPKYLEFAVEHEGEHIGSVTLYWFWEDRGVAELAWMLNPAHRGNGYAAEAARALMEFAFETLGVCRLIAQCDVRNVPSFQLMKKLGMTLTEEGTRTYPKTGETAGELTCVLERENRKEG